MGGISLYSFFQNSAHAYIMSELNTTAPHTYLYLQHTSQVISSFLKDHQCFVRIFRVAIIKLSQNSSTSTIILNESWRVEVSIGNNGYV